MRLPTAQRQPELDVLARAQERDQARLLPDDGDVRPPERGSLLTVEPRDVLAQHDDVARSGQLEPGEQVQEGGLA